MRPRVLALTRTSSDEEAARASLEELADVELIDVRDRDATALIHQLGVDRLPAWLYPLGEGMVVAVGSPAPLIERLRAEVSRPLDPAMGSLEDQEHESASLEQVVNVFLNVSRAAQAQINADRARLTRAEVLCLIDERADELHPATQISRLVRRLHIRPPSPSRSESNESW
ncbi:hypothetical protein [Actinomyces weissii]|uniref:Uncharacterized protein n=1 Tax=Actinomyces weissii TaxID=675090 RepID=A0A7T7M9M9_9ACTO|nr:hypothetical protein [Actinomyces weissii]QQM67479.1 hypothetical protein JG540_00795 [Actinomyces weissii]